MGHRARRTLAGAAAVAMLGAVGACGGPSAPSSSDATHGAGKATLTWWHVGTSDPLLGVYRKAATAYHQAHPDITIKPQPIQNEQLTTKLPLALHSDTPPDIFHNQGGGTLATQVKSGKVADITAETKGWISRLGPAAAGWQVDGKQYGVPVDSHVVGFWYNKKLFARAGITTTPTTMAAFDADLAKLKAHHVTPIALGGKDRWPDAFYYDEFAVRECSTSTITAAVKAVKFSDPCFTKAGQDVLDLIKLNPFQKGFNGTPSQQGSGSSAGMVADGKAAMELQGDWDMSVMTALATDKHFAANIGWFPFPTTTGGAGDPTASLGGGDGFACSTRHAADCAGFLKYLTGATVQKQLVASNSISIPVNPAAVSALKSPVMKKIYEYNTKATHVQEYFDIALPTAVGQALDDAAADLFAGKGNAGSVAAAVNSAG